MAARRPPSRSESALIVLAVLSLLGAVAGCSRAAHVQATTTTRPRPGTPARPVAPSSYSVHLGRFVESVELAGKLLEVNPPPEQATPLVTAAQAKSLFEAYEAFNGIYKFDLLGLGDATLDQTASQTALLPSAGGNHDDDSADHHHDGSSPHHYDDYAPAHPTTTTTRAPPPTTTTARSAAHDDSPAHHHDHRDRRPRRPLPRRQRARRCPRRSCTRTHSPGWG